MKAEFVSIPKEAVMPEGGQTLLIVAMAVLALVAFVYAISESRRRGNHVTLFLVLGSGLAVFYEGLGDHLVHVYYPERDQVTWITSFGLDIPVFIGLLYFWYMALTGMKLLRLRDSGTVDRRKFLVQWFFTAWFFVAFEIVALMICDATWIYYGPQVFVVGDIPVLTPFSFAAFTLGIGVTAIVFDRAVPRSYQWLLIPAVPLAMAASHTAVSFPLASALWSTDNNTIIAVASIASAGLAILAACGVAKLMSTQWFFEPNSADRPRVDDLVQTGAASQS